MQHELQGKVAVITGGSRGIGLAIAQALAAAGSDVAICGRDPAALERAKEVLLRSGGRVLTCSADVTEPVDAQRLVDACVEAFGRVDCLINNVGGSRGGDLLSSSDADWQSTFERNVFQSVRLTRLVVPVMARGGGGSIVNISSISGWQPQLSGTLQYGTAKAALIYLTEPLALELAKFRIRVNVVSPGSILWDGGGWWRFRDDDASAFDSYLEHGFPLGRLGGVSDVAEVVLFLASERSAWINGRHIPVDGLQQPAPPPGRRLW